MNAFTQPASSPQQTATPALGGLFKSTLTALRERRERRVTRQDRGKLLEQVIADLEGLNRSTEQGFLAIGGKLTEFLAASRQIATDMAALGELIAGSHGSRTTQVLTRVLERSRDAQARTEAGDRTLAGLCDATRQIGRTFGGFRDTVAAFRVLGSLTRIETARLGNAGAEFGNLAEEVNALTHSIESNGQDILDASSVLHRNMQSALARVTGFRASELKELPALIAGIMSSFGSLEDRYQRAVDASLQQAAEYEKVSAAIGDLITAIQFHDITRQEIEHVAGALTRLRSEFRGGRRNRSAAMRDAGALLTLQSSQLSSAEQVFAASVGRIERDLDGIAERVRNMAESGKTLMGLSADEQDSFFLRMEGRCTGILNVFGTCATAEAEIHATLAELEEAVRRMRQSVGKVREVEISIRRIAINATIRAVQIGDAGCPLLVLAEVMHRLALDSNRIIEEVAATLDAISGAATLLSGASSGSDAGDVLSGMRTAILELHSSGEAGFSRLHQIAALSSRLGEEIRSARAGFSAGALLAETFHRARGVLEQIGGRGGPTRLEDLDVAAKQRLEDIAARYTMQSERDVHDSMTTGVAANPLAAAGAPVALTNEEDLGENVEFF